MGLMDSIANGLSAAGGAIADTSGKLAIQLQKDQADQAKLKLADQLQGARELSLQQSQQTFQGGETDKQLKATSSENALNREAQAANVKTQASAELGAASIQANALPAEVKAAKWFSTATPETQTSYARLTLLAKGIPPQFIPSDPLGNGSGGASASGSASTPAAPSSAGASPASQTPSATASPINFVPDALRGQTPAMVNQVKAIGEGRTAAPSGNAMRNPESAAIMALVNQAYPGYDATTYSGRQAASSALGTRTGQMAVAVEEVNKFAPMALQAADAVDAKQFPTLNAIKQAVDKGTGDQNIVKFNTANNALVNAYSQIIARGTPTDSSRKAAEDLLSTAFSNGQYHAVAEQIQKEAAMAAQAPADARASLAVNAPAPAAVIAGSPSSQTTQAPALKITPLPANPTPEKLTDGAIYPNPKGGYGVWNAGTKQFYTIGGQ